MRRSVLMLVLWVCLHGCISAKSPSSSTPTFNFDRRFPRRSRETYMLSMFEIMMSTLETKLRRVENLDRAVQVLMRKMDGIERVLRVKVVPYRAPDENSLRKINDKIDKIEYLLSPEETDGEETFVAQASERKSRRVSPDGIATSSVSSAVEDMKKLVNGMDRKLGFHINVVTENLGKMTNLVEDVHTAVMDDETENNGSSRIRISPVYLNATRRIKKLSKLDKLMDTLGPLTTVSNKVDEVKGMMLNTKISVDDLVPKSEQLLSQTHRQERAISHIHSDLNEKTNKIIRELTQVEREFTRSKESVGPPTNNAEFFSAQGNEGPFTSPLSSTVPITTTYSTSRRTLPTTTVSTTRKPFRTTKKPSVIFPSIENKPILINTSFTYDAGINKGGIKGYSCADLYNKGLKSSGMYYLQIGGIRFWYLKVYCEMETAGGGWTVIQRRNDFGIPRESFNRDWNDYKYGFGKVDREFWIGNENIYMFTNNEEYEIRIDLEDFESNKRYAEYKDFKLGSENERYRLQISGYQGTAGDSLNDPWYGSNLRPFSTFDSDHDRSSLNCASMLKGGWWWKSCGRSLNGLYLTDPQDSTARQGIVWFRWRGWDYTLKRSRMMIRPKRFRRDSRKNKKLS